MSTEKIIWALLDGRAGNDNQTLAVAEKLGNFIPIKISFSKLAQLPNCLLGTSKVGIKNNFEPPYPDLVIAAGRKLSRVSRYIKKISGAKIVHIMWPDAGHQYFDLIFTPKHDKKSKFKNVRETVSSISKITPTMQTGANKVAVLIGAPKISEAKKLITQLEALNKPLLITTSRRTTPNVVEYLKTKKGHKIYLWGSAETNPYKQFLSEADYIVATEDSVSMISDAIHTGKPTYIFQIATKPKHKEFSKTLVALHYARIFDSEIHSFSPKPVNTLDFITSEIARLK